MVENSFGSAKGSLRRGLTPTLRFVCAMLDRPLFTGMQISMSAIREGFDLTLPTQKRTCLVHFHVGSAKGHSNNLETHGFPTSPRWRRDAFLQRENNCFPDPFRVRLLHKQKIFHREDEIFFGRLNALSFEHLLKWISQMMFVYNPSG